LHDATSSIVGMPGHRTITQPAEADAKERTYGQ
jgi:hypothetical protein